MLSCKKFCQFLLTFPPYQAKTLRIFQGCFTVQLSRLFILLSQATTSISYHSHSLLSTTFFIFLKFCIFQTVFSDTKFFMFLPPFSAAKIIISRVTSFVNNFLGFLFFIPRDRKSFQNKIILKALTEKEGFEPSRRLPDLYP